MKIPIVVMRRISKKKDYYDTLAGEIKIDGIIGMERDKGKKLFNNGTIPAAFTLIESSITPSGVIIANHKRAGKVKAGTIGA